MEIKSKSSKKQYPFQIKKEAVDELEKGWESEDSLCAKYNILPKTLRNWQIQVGRGVIGFKKRLKISDAEKRKAVREIQSGAITIPEAVVKYGTKDRQSIVEWIKRFSSDIGGITSISMPKSHEEQKDMSAIGQRCKDLEKALSNAHVQIAGLETLIDVAEKELSIDIRKKSGTKQS